MEPAEGVPSWAFPPPDYKNVVAPYRSRFYCPAAIAWRHQARAMSE
jgi:hypothetical protein